ncbi:MAG: hypothetical protein L0Y78_09750 [candidate division NC10 bacterium]|nr:hypothetical protein [candidate division NC10 bacterium]
MMIRRMTEKDFSRFVDSLPECERIPRDRGKHREGRQQADYFFRHKGIIAELKCFDEDMTSKLQLLADMLMKQRNLVLLGSMSFNGIFRSQPDYPKLVLEAIKKADSALVRAFTKANSQIQHTKEDNTLPDSLGLLILFNNENKALDPGLSNLALRYCLQQHCADGRPKYGSIDACIYRSCVAAGRRANQITYAWQTLFLPGKCDSVAQGYIKRLVEWCDRFDWEEGIPWEGQDRLDDPSWV